MSRILRFLTFSLAIGLLLCPFALYAQGGDQVSVTGCLQQGSEHGGYYVMGQDGKLYELMGKSVNLSQHLNQTVTVSGKQVKLSESQETKVEPHEKTESSGGSSYVDVQVGDLKVVSQSCSH